MSTRRPQVLDDENAYPVPQHAPAPTRRAEQVLDLARALLAHIRSNLPEVFRSTGPSSAFRYAHAVSRGSHPTQQTRQRGEEVLESLRPPLHITQGLHEPDNDSRHPKARTPPVVPAADIATYPIIYGKKYPSINGAPPLNGRVPLIFTEKSSHGGTPCHQDRRYHRDHFQGMNSQKGRSGAKLREHTVTSSPLR
jgi:hypothetical protein